MEAESKLTYKEIRDYLGGFYIQPVLNKPLPYPAHIDLTLELFNIYPILRSYIQRTVNHEEAS